MRRFYYIFSLIFIFTIPAIVESFFIPPINFSNLTTFALGITFIGSAWDIWATKHGKGDRVWLWQFNKKDTLGLTFFDLPIEEYLFYLSTSIYIIFTWELIKHVSTSSNLHTVYLLVGLTIWTLFFITLPYLYKPRRDRIR